MNDFDDSPVPIYGAPVEPQTPIPEKIKGWNLEYGYNAYRDIVLVKKLKEILADENKVAEILETLDNVCKDCWNEDISNGKHCYCTADW